ncbi:MAG: hypothetical protein ACD_2C00042G0003 [uncultured bacterium (gcode 4)]|uniref:Uncharacterized protein n=1 Tax=uncultured bacterium (gcode 4) TaxID=1234023 RepID=K2GI32_9BACT|nr:MAG: hypothetical protein ACD_2C00042G0003 [uncultured bacterium (gcode 4)]
MILTSNFFMQKSSKKHWGPAETHSATLRIGSGSASADRLLVPKPLVIRRINLFLP